MRPTFFGLQDASGKAWDYLTYGSLRLWDSSTSWVNIETAPGVYDWSRLDAYVAAAETHGTEVTWTIAYVPPFYGSTTKMPPIEAYRALVGEAMTRYGTRISTYQVWNEANVNWSWTDSMTQMAALASAMRAQRDAIVPKARVLSPSFAVRLPYERQALAEYLTCWTHDDAIALSLYPLADGGTPEDAYDLLDKVKQFPGVGSRPFWVAEINYGVGAPLKRLGMQHVQIGNVMRTYLLGAYHRVERVHWYRYDWNRTQAGWLGNTMLSDPTKDYVATQAGLSITTVQQWLDGATVDHLAVSNRGVHRLYLRVRGGRRLVIWHPTRQVTVAMPDTKVFYGHENEKRRISGGKMWVGPSPRMVVL